MFSALCELASPVRVQLVVDLDGRQDWSMLYQFLSDGARSDAGGAGCEETRLKKPGGQTT
jgi:hypothetical protein